MILMLLLFKLILNLLKCTSFYQTAFARERFVITSEISSKLMGIYKIIFEHLIVQYLSIIPEQGLIPGMINKFKSI